MSAIHCSHCGSPVRVQGKRWECGYCGDFGGISTLHPSEKAKPIRAAMFSVPLTVTVTGISDGEEAPRRFSRTELEDMVRRWDFGENEWAIRDLLIASFPEAVSSWTEEELSQIDTQDLLAEVGGEEPGSSHRYDEAAAGHCGRPAPGRGGGGTTSGLGHGRPPARSGCTETAAAAAEMG